MNLSSEQLHNLLRRCTVGIRLSKGKDEPIIGTGFFVAQGMILTCAHVVSGHRTVWIVVHDDKGKEQSYQASVKRRLNEEYPDTALLRLKDSNQPQHPCVRLIPCGEPVEVFAFGYCQTEDYAGGMDLFGQYGGLAYMDLKRSKPLFRLGEWQNIQGISGGPVLDRRTGGIIGIIASENYHAGEAVPIEVILREIPEVAEANLKFHCHDHTWRDLEPESEPPFVHSPEHRILVIGNGWFPYMETKAAFPECVLAADNLYSALDRGKRAHLAESVLLINHDATAMSIAKAFTQLRRAPTRSSNFIFWSGWSDIDDPSEQYILFCYDSRRDGKNCISVGQIRNWVEELEAYDQSLFLFMDCRGFPARLVLPKHSQRIGVITWKENSTPDHSLITVLEQFIESNKGDRFSSAKDLCDFFNRTDLKDRLDITNPYIDFSIF